MRPSLVFRGPIASASGYGVHARQVLHAVLAMNAFEVSIQETSWGDTGTIFDDSAWGETIRALATRGRDEEGRRAYDLSIQVDMPHQYARLARVNIGVTAGIETDRVAPEWITVANATVDLIIVPSQHSKAAFEKSKLALRPPLVVCPLGFDATHFNTHEAPGAEARFPVESEWNFLFVGLGLHLPMGEDRKNVGELIKWFCQEFAGDARVGLIVKTALSNASEDDRRRTFARIAEIKRCVGAGELPRVYLIHGRIDDAELALLYKHPRVRAFISLTHGEGFGLPLIEAAACGLPVIATAWSGHLDFLGIDGERKFLPVDYDLAPVPSSFVMPGIAGAEARWAYPRERHARAQMRHAVSNHAALRAAAEELAQHLALSPASVAAELADVLRPFAASLRRFERRLFRARLRE